MDFGDQNEHEKKTKKKKLEDSWFPLAGPRAWYLAEQAYKLCPEIRGRPPRSWVGLRARGQAEAVVINTSSEWAGAQCPRPGPWCYILQKNIKKTLPGLNKRDIVNTFIPQIPLLLLALKSQTHLPTVPSSTTRKTQTPSIPNYNSQEVLRSGGLQ